MSAPASAHTLYGNDPDLLSPTALRLWKRGWLKWAIALAASLGAILEVIDTVITNVALPDIRGTLGATLSEAGWVSTGYACANVVIIPLSAWLGDRFGRKNYFVFSLFGFIAASALCGVSSNLAMLIFARILQGLAGGGLLAKAQSIVFEAFSTEERGVAQAVFGLGVIVGPAVGPVLGGWLTDNLGWRWIFFINVPVGIFAAFMCLIFLPRDQQSTLERHGVDWTGIALLAIGLASFQVMLEEGHEHDWFASKLITGMAVASAVGTSLFIWHSLRTPHPAVDLRVLRHPSMIGGSLYSAILGMGLYGIIFAIPVFVQDYLHFTALQSGLLLMPGAIASAVAMLLFGKVARRFSPRLVICVGALLTTTTGLMLMHITPQTGAPNLFWPLVLRGLGGVLIFLPLSMATLGPLPKRDIAAGAGFYSLTRQLGSSIGVALITTLLARQVAEHRGVLVERISSFREPALERIQMLTSGLGSHERAMALLDRIVDGQAILLSYRDLFFYVAALFVFSLPILLLLGGKTPLPDEAVAAAH